MFVRLFVTPENSNLGIKASDLLSTRDYTCAEENRSELNITSCFPMHAVADPDLEVREGGKRSQKFIFALSLFWCFSLLKTALLSPKTKTFSFGPKIRGKGGGGRGPLLDPPLACPIWVASDARLSVRLSSNNLRRLPLTPRNGQYVNSFNSFNTLSGRLVLNEDYYQHRGTYLDATLNFHY